MEGIKEADKVFHEFQILRSVLDKLGAHCQKDFQEQNVGLLSH